MVDPGDRYADYYAGKLWSLVPAIYRLLDDTPQGTSDDAGLSGSGGDQLTGGTAPLTTTTGSLREIVNRIGVQIAVVRRSIDRMWQDQSIETCDDWVVPYIAELLGVNLPPFGGRVDVAKTIYYRRRKGTLPALEEIADDITGWDVKVVEFSRRICRATHSFDPPLGWPRSTARGSLPRLDVAEGLVAAKTHTPAGGLADLRNAYGASRAQTPFDEFSHTADLRSGAGSRGWQNIPHLGVFLYRLQSFSIDGVTPVAYARDPHAFTFDPTGREIPLFATSVRAYGSEWRSPTEPQLPGSIDERLLAAALADLYASIDPVDLALVPNAMRIYSGVPSQSTLVPISQVTADPRKVGQNYSIDPARGRLRVPPAIPQVLRVGYHYGFSSAIGAGGYDRRVSGQPLPALSGSPVLVSGGDANFATVASGVSSGTVEIQDSLTYHSAPDLTVTGAGGPNALVVCAANRTRPVLRPARGKTWSKWTITGSVSSARAGSCLIINGLLLSGPSLELAGSFDSVTISTCTLDPGGTGRFAKAVDGQPLAPTRLRVTGQIRRLHIDRSIVGSIVVHGDKALVEHLVIDDSIVHATAPGEPALAIGTGRTDVRRCTVLGSTRVQKLEASNSIFSGQVSVADCSYGCVRYSAFAPGSLAPRPYACVHLTPDRLFASTAFGRPEYAQLVSTADPRIVGGADDGSEMGAFCREKAALKRRSLLLKYQEQVPIELAPVFIDVT